MITSSIRTISPAVKPHLPLPLRRPSPSHSFLRSSLPPLRRFPSLRHASTRSSTSLNASKDRTRSRPFLWVLGVMPIFTFALGTWQVKRLGWKLDLIDSLEQKLNRDTVRLPGRVDQAAIPEFAYRKVYLKGTFDHSKEILLGPKTRDGEIGYHVITPLVRGEGQDVVLVNRGFVKREKMDQKSRPESLTNGEVEITGMLRSQETPNSFTPANSPQKGQWIWSDIREMADWTGSAPVLVDEIYTGNAGLIGMKLREGSPVGRAATIELRNQHLTYAITWYSLSVATAFMFIRLRRPAKRLTASEFRGVS